MTFNVMVSDVDVVLSCEVDDAVCYVEVIEKGEGWVECGVSAPFRHSGDQGLIVAVKVDGRNGIVVTVMN